MKISVADIKFHDSGRKKPVFDWVSFILILVAIGIIIVAVYFIFYFKESRVLQLMDRGETLSGILVEKNGDVTESIFLTFYNPKTEKLGFIMIPGSTRLKVEYENAPQYDTVSNIYKKGNALVIKNTVEKLTGRSFPFYMIYDLKDVEKLVDLIEGLKVNIPKPVDYVDSERGIIIKVPDGKQLLDGAKVKEYLLYRYGERGLKDYLENHRNILDALVENNGEILEIIQHTWLLRSLLKSVDTNLTIKDVKVVSERLQRLNPSRILFYKMFGRLMEIKGKKYLIPVENGEWLRGRIKELMKFMNNDGPAPIGDDVRIEILNGSNNPGQAQSLRNYFIEYGFNVVHYGNAMRNDYEKTVVIDRVGKPILAKRIADIINCKEVYTKIDKSLMVDVTIILGNDFEGNYVR